MQRTVLILWTMLISCSLVAVAQDVPVVQLVGRQEITLEQLSIRHGLSQGMVNDMAEDSKGHLWIATKEGLNRYDGNRFKVFRHDPSDSLSLADNFTYSLEIDRYDRIWIATQSHGVDMFDPRTNRFHHYTVAAEPGLSLTSDNIGLLLKDHDGNILAETLDADGFNVILCGSDTTESGKERYRVKTVCDVYPQLKRFRTGKDWTKHLTFRGQNSIWYYDNDSIYRFTDSEYNSYPFDKRDFRGHKQETVFIQNEWSDDIYVHDGDRMLLRYDTDADRFQPCLKLGGPYSFWDKQFIASNGQLWTWTETGEVLQIDLEEHTFKLMRPLWQRLERMAQNHTGISIEDKNGNLWMGTGGNGLLKISRYVGIFNAVPTSEPVYNHGVYLFRTEKAGKRHLFDPEARKTWMRLKKQMDSKFEDLRFSDSQCHLTIDDNGFFWTGGYFEKVRIEHLFKVDTSTLDHQIVASAHHDTSEWFAMPVFIDHKNDIWFGEKYSVDRIFLYHYVRSEDSLYRYRFPVEKHKYEYRFISDWLEDDEGNWWFATTEGLFHFNVETHAWQKYQNRPDDSTSLSLNMTLSVCPDPEDPQRYIWVGTEGRGLNRLDIATGEFKRITMEDGLPNGVIYGILPDEFGDLWVSTNQGLVKYDLHTEEMFTYTEAEGLPGNEFNRYEYSVNQEGVMYFGGTGGVMHFDPKDLQITGKGSVTVINGLEVSNQPVHYEHAGNGVLSAPVGYCKEIVLENYQNTIGFQFSVLDLTSPSQNKFRYRLMGFQEKWVEVGRRQEAFFTNLDPGSYTFEVQGYNSFGKWSETPASISLTILPPWYSTWWFRIVMTIVVILSLYGFYRYRLAQLLKVERMRNRIAQDLHDEIGSTLSSISLYSAVMQRSSDKLPVNFNDILGKIIDSTSEMMESMNDMVWTIKADNDSFEHVVYRMRAFASNMTEAKDIILLFKVDPKAEKLELGMELRKNIYLIFKEAVNNAVKYSECQRLSVVIRQEENVLIVQIKDNGIGFDTDSYDQNNQLLGGNGLSGMRGRAQEIGADLLVESAQGNGCTITLILAA